MGKSDLFLETLAKKHGPNSEFAKLNTLNQQAIEESKKSGKQFLFIGIAGFAVVLLVVAIHRLLFHLRHLELLCEGSSCFLPLIAIVAILIIPISCIVLDRKYQQTLNNIYGESDTKSRKEIL